MESDDEVRPDEASRRGVVSEGRLSLRANVKTTAQLMVVHRNREAAPTPIESSANERVNQKARSVIGRVRSEEIKELHIYTFQGQLEEVRECLRRNRDLVHAQGDATDLSGRLFPQITGFQRAIWDGREDMWNVYLEILSEADAYDQLMALNNERPDITKKYGAPISFLDRLIASYENYKAQSTAENWNRGVGGALSTMPAWFVYIFSDEGSDKAWPRKQMTSEFTRNVKHLKTWFEIGSNGSKCGSVCAFVRGGGSKPVACGCNCGRGWRHERWCGLPGCTGMRGSDGCWTPELGLDLENTTTLKSECTQKLAELTARLCEASKKASQPNVLALRAGK